MALVNDNAVPIQERHQALANQKRMQQHSTVNSGTRGILRERYSGPTDTIYSVGCPNVGNNLGKSLSECMDLCDAKPSCTAFNYKSIHKDCVLRACPQPIATPTGKAPGYKGYAKITVSTSSVTTPSSVTDMANSTTRPEIETTKQTTAFTTNSSTMSSRPNINSESISSTAWHDNSTSVEPVREICPDEYVEIGTQCIIMTNKKVNWNQAKATCEENSAELVSLKDPVALRDYVIEMFPKSSFWIGGRYYRNPDGWQWLSGDSFNSSFPWGINDRGVQQDKGEKQDCMILRYFPIQDEQEYVDNWCKKKNYFICEKPKMKTETSFTVQTDMTESSTA